MNITKGKIKRACRGVMYGPEGIGKSTLASFAPHPLFIDLEDGTAQLDVSRVVGLKGWEDLIATVGEVAASPGEWKTLVIDTADKAEMMCIQYICDKHKQTSIESFGYGKGYTILQEEYSKLLGMLDKVIDSGINVIILAHAKMRKQELPDEAGAFDRWELKLTRQVSPIVKEWADAVLFINYKTHVITIDSKTKKATGGKRVIYTSHHACWDAKNRHGLPEEMDLEYSNIAPLFEDHCRDITAGDTRADTPYVKFKELMDKAGVNEAEVRKVVSDKGHYPMDINISDYDERFISGWLIAHWERILPIILSNRNSDD